MDFHELAGETLVCIEGMEPASAQIKFFTESGREFSMYHVQDCCESVVLEDVIGNPADLLNTPLLKADESSNSNDISSGRQTWTFYLLATVKGHVTLRWLGESNGHYSESVAFYELPTLVQHVRHSLTRNGA